MLKRSLLWLVRVMKECVLSVLVYWELCQFWMFLSHVELREGRLLRFSTPGGCRWLSGRLGM